MSDQNSRNRIVELLQSLPGKVKNKNLVGNLRRFAEQSEVARDRLTLSIEGAVRVKLVFPDAQIAGLTEKLANAKKKARACQKDLLLSIDSVSKPTFESRQIEIKESGENALKPVLDIWQRRLDGAIKPYEKLAKVVEERRLEGGKDLKAMLQAIYTARTQTPQSDEKARAIGELIEKTPDVVRSLGLGGMVGNFLIAVAEGSASPRDLEIVEIREFLSRYGLWETLRVSFGDTQ